MSSVLAPPTPATDGHTARWLGTHRKLLAAAMELFDEDRIGSTVIDYLGAVRKRFT